MEIYAAKLEEGRHRGTVLLCPGTQENRPPVSAAAWLLLRGIIREKLGLSEKQIIFAGKKYGKPILINDPDFHFNISHSGRWAVIVTDSAPVGIDIEMVRPVDYLMAHGFFSADEYRDLMSRDEAGRLDYFFSLWTLKESYVKMLGEGFYRPFDSFTIKVGRDGAERLEDPNQPEPVYFKQYKIDEGYRLSVCASNDRFPEAVSIGSGF